MKKIVLDTNIYISALIFDGRPLDLLVLAETGLWELLISPEILSELQRRLEGKFGWSEEAVARATEKIILSSKLVRPKTRILASKDPDDNKIIECSVDGRADYIVSGDKHLLVLKEFAGIKIVDVRRFLDVEIWRWPDIVAALDQF